MPILISPSDNTGWGLGKLRIRATGLTFTDSTPVSVRHYFRDSGGQRNGRATRAHLRRNLKKYRRKHDRRTHTRRVQPDVILIKAGRRTARSARRRSARKSRSEKTGPRIRYTRRI
ncbi:pVII [Snake adenovirus 1]|uniref:Pre-histone-like nucleoprotein n=1 Tax=Snake adenovirus serotype 1 TaxID=189830 RepID=NP_ADES1|nr:pVII [Snake adenovirus 1]Q8JN70.1 RecName: Full=Pre-histone-like nucleoprotein; AltName: Full=Pre-core protein VII; Short=pVII; Contains: RecName: Full=Histone-like nucleoprotein; Short=NP; AltName: Full=Core protein VII [Snake adenovirus 1]AAL92449.1 pVII [Snake adenovirus 1]